MKAPLIFLTSSIRADASDARAAAKRAERSARWRGLDTAEFHAIQLALTRIEHMCTTIEEQHAPAEPRAKAL